MSVGNDGHKVTPDYAVTGWLKAFRIVGGEHLKMRLNVLVFV
jgi:hypothetical protein